VGAAVQRKFGSLWLWVVTAAAFILFPIGFWPDLVESWHKADRAITVGALFVTAMAFTVVPAYGIWRFRNRNPPLGFWRHAAVGLLATYAFYLSLGALAGVIVVVAYVWRAV